MKEVIGFIAAALVIVGYIPYIRDILRGKTHPHIYSWFLWALLAVAISGIQISHHAGAGSFITVAAGIMCVAILLLSIKKGKRDIVLSDKIVLILTILTIIFWLFVKRPLLAIILASLADLLAFVPTVRKSWNKPFSETLVFYQLNTLRFALAILALEQITLITALWPAMWAVGNGLFAAMLIYRRKTVPAPAGA